MCGRSGTITYAYNGLGDRLQQTVNPLSGTGGVTTTFTLDLASSLTQILEDGTTTYTYGVGLCSMALEHLTRGTFYPIRWAK